MFGGRIQKLMQSQYDHEAAQKLLASRVGPERQHYTLQPPRAVTRGLAIVVGQQLLAVGAGMFFVGVIEFDRALSPSDTTLGVSSLLTSIYYELRTSIAVAVLVIGCAAVFLLQGRQWALRVIEAVILWRAEVPVPLAWSHLTWYLEALLQGRTLIMLPFTGRILSAFVVWTIGGAIALIYLESRASRAWYRRARVLR